MSVEIHRSPRHSVCVCTHAICCNNVQPPVITTSFFLKSKIDSCVSVRSAQYSGQIYTEDCEPHILILGCWWIAVRYSTMLGQIHMRVSIYKTTCNRIFKVVRTTPHCLTSLQPQVLRPFQPIPKLQLPTFVVHVRHKRCEEVRKRCCRNKLKSV